jgi:hypothetical protein
MKGDMITDGHLGGYVEGGDDATFYPNLWAWLAQDPTLAIKSVLDVGCGEGHALDVFKNHGVFARGVDGMPQNRPDISTHDFTKGPYLSHHAYGLCWSCEFVEHVEERYLHFVLDTFACAKLVLMTHAVPGQGGYHHVNCQPAEYWIGAMAAIGYQYSPMLTTKTRQLAAINPSPWNHYAQRGLAFKRYE